MRGRWARRRVVEPDFDVGVVGFGPVGALLANLLGRYGLRVLVLERDAEIHPLPRAVHFDGEVMRVFQAAGLAGAVAEVARATSKGMHFVNAAGETLMVRRSTDGPGPHDWATNWYFHQPELDAALRKGVARLANVDVRLRHEATAVRDAGDHASVTVRDAATGATQALTARYVVGCDGARSLVRETAGIASSGEDFDQKMLLAVFRSRELHEAFERFPEVTTYRALDPELQGYWMFFGRVDVGEGWFFHAPVPNDATPDNYDYQALLNRAAGFEFHAEFDHVGFWDLRVTVADAYRSGRLFIAGDSAHSHPPYGGFGLNNGLEDIVNLGWKLAAVLQGWGGESLLDSYGEERRAVFWETGQDFIAAGIRSDREFLERYSPERDRAEFEDAWERMGRGTRVGTYEPNYEGSPVVWGPPGGVCSAHGSHTFTARAGHHVPPGVLSTGRGVHEEFGAWFTLLAFDAQAEAVAGFESAAQELNVPLKVVSDTFEESRAAFESRLILVRPDQYAVWCGDALPSDVDVAALFAKAVGRASP